ncbi:MAG: hypothetical protein ACWA47_00565 [Brevirhabdus sp.]
MALPLAPIAGLALRYGAVAVATYAVARNVDRGRFDQRVEDALDDLDEGVTLRREDDQVNAAGRFRRVVRMGENGPGVEVDITSLTRIRFRRV